MRAFRSRLRVTLAALAALTLAVTPAAAQEPPASGLLETYVLIARADLPFDALAAGAVAGPLGAPVLLSAGHELSPGAASALREAAPAIVVLVGGTSALSPKVEEDVRALGYQVRRVSGSGRIETAGALADFAEQVGAGRPVLTQRPVTDAVVPRLNADKLDGFDAEQLRDAFSGWSLTGNAGTDPATQFLGTTDAQAFEVRVGGHRALRLEPTGPSAGANVLAGSRMNGATAGVVGATVAGGGRIEGDTVEANLVTDEYGAIGGGSGNTAGDGAGTTADAGYATIAGGRGNRAANGSVVGGGATNTATLGSVIGGGATNTATAGSVVGGGATNTATAGSVVGGGSANAADAGSFIGGGEGNGAGNGSVISGGTGNTATAGSTVAGGTGNAASGGGAVSGGQGNTASSGGVVAGGNDNAAALLGAVGGGRDNVASAATSTVPGGHGNQATALRTFAAGTFARAVHPGSIVFSDGTATADAPVSSTEGNQFVVRATQGIWFGQTPPAGPIPNDRFIDTSTGAYLSSAGQWVDVSDRAAKTGFAQVDARDTLRRVLDLDVSTWSYKADRDTSIRHMGPMAQDFSAAFGLGNDDRHIAALDVGGVALSAIQGLHAELQERDDRIALLEARLAALEAAAATPATR